MTGNPIGDGDPRPGRLAHLLRSAARSPRRSLCAVTLLIAATYLIGTWFTTGPPGPLVQGDARFYFAYLPSLVLDQDLDLSDELDVLFPGRDHPRGTDRPLNPFPLHPALLWLPGYLMGTGLDLVTGGLGTGQATGFGPAAAWGAALMGILAAGLAAFATYRLLCGFFDPPIALLATLLSWAGTPALYYTLVTPLYSHTTAWAAVAVMLVLTAAQTRGVNRTSAWLLIGLAGGFAVGARLQDLPLLAVPGLVWLWRSRDDPSQATRTGSAWAVGSFLGYLPQGLNWYLMYRTIIPIEPKLSITDQLSSPGPAKLRAILFSTGYEGWLSWSPLVVICLVGGLWLIARGEPAVRVLAVGALLAVTGMVILDVIHPYGAGASFGGRRYVSATPLLALGLAALLKRSSENDGTPAPLAGTFWTWVAVAAAGWQVALLVSYELLVIRHGVYPTLAQAARHAIGLGIG